MKYEKTVFEMTAEEAKIWHDNCCMSCMISNCRWFDCCENCRIQELFEQQLEKRKEAEENKGKEKEKVE